MHFLNTLLCLSLAALSASAAPVDSSSYSVNSGYSITPTYFGVIAIRSGSPIQNAGFQASDSRLVVGATKQNASCSSNFASFWINGDGELNLFSTDNPPQKVFVDRSGMGQGIVGYVTGAQPLVRNGETKGWAVKNNALEFDGTSLQACPGAIDNAWSLWLSGVTNPGGNSGCLGISTLVVNTTSPVSCTYSQ